ncbi:uroporphyrinogen decarboxylase family protein [Paludibacter jiangxiensis]|uniref:Uroporphyrinogen decarboxylase n=1 Tax=Paludibacter jiangxiensis TaxID=681398 RepID=A0A161LIJ7_9BACT|nr:uroporphyrinogen decarboxylase family protein [Paludibacter jiangxiensis]GAT62236.1 uroporphyrinogen decarboxylase [Paludibacter jiangxiensis]
MKSWIDSILTSKQRIALPIMTHPGIEAIGKTVKEAVSDGQVHYEAIQSVAEQFAMPACTSIMDLTVEAEAFGATINLPDNEVPTVTGRLVSDAASIAALEVPSLDKGRVSAYLLANKLAAENITGKPVFSGCIGPFSLAGRLYDMSEIMVGIYIEPDAINELLSKCTQFLIDYCRALKASGTQGVVMAEPAAGLLSNEDCQMYSSEYVKQIVEAVQDDNFTVILHNCGNTGHCTEAMLATGARALHFGNKIDMVQALNDCPSDVIVMGNLDPVGVFKMGTPDEVYVQTKALLEKTANYANFVISSGCDIPPHASNANIEAFFSAVKDYNNNM